MRGSRQWIGAAGPAVMLASAALGLTAAVVTTSAAVTEGVADVPGAADPEGLPRIAGAQIIGFDQSDFDSFSYPTGPATWDDAGVKSSATAEGPRSRLIYVVPGDRSPLEVMRNYQAELTQQGYETVYSCDKDDCGEASRMVAYLYPLGERLTNLGQITEYAFSFPRPDQRYLVARQPDSGRLVSIYTAFQTFDQFPETTDKVMVLLDVVEAAPLKQRMEFVSADQMATALDTAGRISLYGILFDHDSDRVKPESDPTLAEIAALLKADPGLRLFVVGHTDMTGAYDYNLDLSRRRAAAVVGALTGNQGIARDVLEPAGIGPLSPVADNATEDGRSQNRRVELVKR